VEQLPGKLREVADLVYYNELTYVAAAEALDVNERTVRRRWERALAELHRILRGEWPEL
jgi:RNA polymerase sigma factor (sigma-70 family)